MLAHFTTHMFRRSFTAAFTALGGLCLVAAPLSAALATQSVRVRMDTSAGAIVIELAVKQAPITAANFLAYVDQKRFDGTRFYRAARVKGLKGAGFIQGGIQHSFTRMLPPIAHEPTSKTGLSHVTGTISMARDEPGSAMGDFFIMASDSPSMNASRSDPGYAAFGRVVSGMPVVRKILAGATIPNAGNGGMKNQMLADPVRIISARRVK